MLKRLKHKLQPNFKRKGHKRQFQLLEEVKDQLEWKVMEAYESDNLTSGNEDANRIERAEKTAEKTTEQRAKKKIRLAQKRSKTRAVRCGTKYGRDVIPQQGSSRTFPAASSVTALQLQRRIPGPCFKYLEMGHLKMDCPKEHKLYPLSRLEHEGDDVCVLWDAVTCVLLLVIPHTHISIHNVLIMY